MNTQPSCLSVNADTIESFPVESPVSYDDIQDETITPMDRRSMGPNVSDAVLNCDCRVSVCCDSHLPDYLHSFFFHRWTTSAYCVKAGVRGGTTFGTCYKVRIIHPSPVLIGAWGT